METTFKYLFTPIKIGSQIVKNRLVWAPHTTLMATRDGMPVMDQWKAYFEERAKGGVGLIITEPLNVHPTSQPYDESLRGWDERIIPILEKTATAVHAHGAKILAQIAHMGQYSKELFTERETWAPSSIPPASRVQTPKEMEIEDIKEVVAGFIKTARYVQRSGYDGCELHGAHNYLLWAFISPLANKRKDEYGGSVDNRLRIYYEIIDGIRKECGKDFVMGIRLGGDDLAPGGLSVADFQEIVQKLEAHGGLDFFDMFVSTYFSVIPGPCSMDIPLGYATYVGKAIKEIVKDTPVFVVGAIKDPIQAENILADGYADMISMCRALIADPEFPLKAKEGRADDIRPCIRCLQGCHLRRFPYETWPSCVMNPISGRETTLGNPVPAEQKKRVVVVGGGPAGLEAARVAALRGHHVALYEKSDKVGGQINIHVKQPKREEFGESVRWLWNQVNKLGVEIHLNTEVTPEMIMKLNPEVTIIATGSRPLRSGFSANRPGLDGIPGADSINVISVWEVLQETVSVGENVVVIDNEGNQAGAGTAEFLAEKGKKLTVVTRFPMVGYHLGTERVPSLFMPRIVAHGANLYPAHNVKEIREREVSLMGIYTQREVIIKDVDTVVLNTGWEPNSELYFALKSKLKAVYRIGDCLAPRDTLNAIFDGHRLARAI